MTSAEKESLNEKELPDNYPVHYDYWYMCDGKFIKSDIKGTVTDLKRDLRTHFKLKAKVITNCNIERRKEINLLYYQQEIQDLAKSKNIIKKNQK